jgi:hypothetical protein
MQLLSRTCSQLLPNNSPLHKIHQPSSLQMLARLKPKMLLMETNLTLMML